MPIRAGEARILGLGNRRIAGAVFGVVDVDGAPVVGLELDRGRVHVVAVVLLPVADAAARARGEEPGLGAGGEGEG